MPFIGTDTMGGSVGTHLLATSTPLVVFGPDPRKFVAPSALGVSFAVDAALACPARMAGKAATKALLPHFYTGCIHHHITTTYGYGCKLRQGLQFGPAARLVAA